MSNFYLDLEENLLYLKLSEFYVEKISDEEKARMLMHRGLPR